MLTPHDIEEMVTTLLALEAREALQMEAEQDLTTPLADAWFGRGVHQAALEAATIRLALAEAEHASATRCFAACPTPALGDAVDHWRHAMVDADVAVAQVNTEIEAAIAASRDQLVAERVTVLRDQYLRWSERLYRINPFHPALPQRLQQWLYRQQQKRRFDNPNNRLLAVLEIRESTLHAWAFGTLPLSERDEGMAGVAPHASKREERLERVLEQQFYHPNGDRRVDRADRWGPDQPYDFSASDYDGTPELAALPHEPTRCGHCGADIKDGVRVDLWPDPEREYDAATIWQAAVGFKVVSAYCECSERVVDYVSLENGPESWDAYKTAEMAAKARLKAYHDRQRGRFATAA